MHQFGKLTHSLATVENAN